MSDVHRLLERAATYRALSLLFAPPTRTQRDELVGLSREVVAPARAELAAIAELADEHLDAAYHALLGPSGVCHDSESDFDLRGVSAKGPMLADVAAFYSAFAFEPAAEPPVALDHVARELGFVGYLALREALATDAGEVENAEICRDASQKFVQAHLGRWVRRFLVRLRDRADEPFLGRSTSLAERLLDELEPGAIAPVTPETSLPLFEPDDDGDCSPSDRLDA